MGALPGTPGPALEPFPSRLLVALPAFVHPALTVLQDLGHLPGSASAAQEMNRPFPYVAPAPFVHDAHVHAPATKGYHSHSTMS